MRRWIGLVGALVAVFATSSGVAAACLCVPPQKVYEESKVAFEGRLMKAEGRTVTYRVSRVYRDTRAFPVEGGDTVTLLFARSLCGEPVAKGGVMPYDTPEGWSINGCSSVEAEKFDRITSRRGQPPEPNSDQRQYSCDDVLSVAGREISRAS